MATCDGVGSIDFSTAVLVDSEDAIARLDRELALTEEKLENGLEELIIAINSLSVDNGYSNVKDAVDSLINTSSLEDCTCIQPEPQDVVAFLQTLSSTIQRNSSVENADCLLDLLQLSCKHGFVLPYQAPPVNDAASSTLSINTVSSSSELEIEQLWNSIRLQLRKQILTKLADPLSCPDTKLSLLQGLVFIYPVDEAWKIYKSHRGQEINKVLSESLRLEDAKPEEVLKIIKDQFPHVNHTLKDMMVADFKMMTSRVFQDLNIYSALKPLYSSKMSNYFVVNLSQPSRTIGSENMNSGNAVTIDERDVLAVSVLASELQEFESAMEDVLHQLNWTSETRSKRISKNQPKGVLKVSREVRMSRLGLGTSGLLPAAMVAELSSKSSDDLKNVQKLEYWWKDTLSGLEEQLSTMIPLLVQQSIPNHETVPHTPLNGTLVCDQQYGWSSFPKYVSKVYGPYFTLLQHLTPIVSATTTLHDVFLLSLRSTINDILMHVYKTKGAEGSSIATDCLQALSLSSYCAGMLLQLHQGLYEGKESSCLVSLREQFIDVMDELAEMLVSYHVVTLSTILLHDAESHNYTDHRAFYEEERCSFSIQMYHLHIESIKHYWGIWLPCNLMQKMLKSVVERSLSKLACRYSLAKPSYKRMRQLRVDITTLLFIVYNNMFTFCDSVCDLLGQADFHSSCQCLLRVLAVVTSPLNALCSAFQRGLKHESHVFSMIPSWLQCMVPGVYPFGVVGFSSLPDKSAIYLIVSILSNQPGVNLPLTLQALTMRESLLAKILCQNLDDLNEQSSCVGLGCSGISCLCSMMQPQKSILMPIARLLATCNEQPQCLAHVLVPIIKQGGGCGNLPGKRELVPPWLTCIKELFAPQIERLIIRCVKDIIELQNESKTKVNTMSNLTRLPCGCPLVKQRNKGKWKDEEHVLNTASETLLSRLSQVVLCFSAPLCLVFQSLQDQVDQEGKSKNAVALEVLCWCVWNTLRTEAFDMSDKSALVTLKRASEMTMEALSMEADEPDTHPLSSDWLKDLIVMTTSHCTQDHLANFNIHPVAEAPLIFQEKYFMGMAVDMATNKQGARDLIFINKLITRNSDWIEDQLEIPALIPQEQNTSFQGHIISEPMTPPTFDPIEQVGKLGRWRFDQEALGEYPWNWNEMFKVNLGLTSVTFRHLFSNRFEMLEGEPLNEDEKKDVAILKEQYELDIELV